MLTNILLMRMMVIMTSMPGAKSEDRAVNKANLPNWCNIGVKMRMMMRRRRRRRVVIKMATKIVLVIMNSVVKR